MSCCFSIFLKSSKVSSHQLNSNNNGLALLLKTIFPGGYSKYTWRGGPTYFFGLKIYKLGIFLGQEICHVFFLGLKKICVFFWVLSPSKLFVSGFRCDQWIRKIFIQTFFQRRVFRVLVFFWVGNFDARYFFGSKISGLCIFWGLQYEALSDPPSCILRVPPLGLSYDNETVSCHLLLPMARMEMDWNLKKLGQLFQVFILCLQKSPKILYWLALLEKIHLISSS